MVKVLHIKVIAYATSRKSQIKHTQTKETGVTVGIGKGGNKVDIRE